MRNSKLSELAKRKGKLLSPWVDHLGDKLALSSWSLERLPEYIWMALILDGKGRTDGIDCCIRIIKRYVFVIQTLIQLSYHTSS